MGGNRKRTNTRKRNKNREDMGGFRSLFEKGFAEQCDGNGISFDYETEKIMWTLPPLPYTPDFIFEKSDGSKMYIEMKGYLYDADKRKMRAVKEQHPDLDIRIIFQKASNKITKAKNSKTYGAWAKYYGFPWAEGRMPSAWKKEIKGHGNNKKQE